MLTAASPPPGPHHRPANVPAFPVNVESLGVTLDGPCAAIAWHNPDEPRVTVWGLSPAGVYVQPGAYDFLRPYEAAAGCLQRGWNVSAGIQYGHKFASDAANEYVAGGYRVQLGAVRVTVLAGAFYEGLNRHRARTPMAVNAWGVFPFAILEVQGRW